MVRLAVAVGLVLSASPLHAQDNAFTVTVPSANIHAAPTTASRVISTAPQGSTFAVARELGSWVAVAAPEATDGIGYLHLSWGTLSNGNAVGAKSASTTLPTATSTGETGHADPQPGNSTGPPGSRVYLPSHVVSAGGRIGIQALSGFAAVSRLWFARPLGAQLELGRATYTSAGLLRMSVTDVGVSAITSFTDLANNAVWIRPYAGGGVGIFRSSLRSASGAAVASDTSLGYQAFGGAEFTSANVPRLAVSADVRHVWARTPFGGFGNSGLGLGLAAHWYVK